MLLNLRLHEGIATGLKKAAFAMTRFKPTLGFPRYALGRSGHSKRPKKSRPLLGCRAGLVFGVGEL